MRPAWRTLPSRSLRLLLDPVAFWSLFGTYEGDPIVFDAWQVAHLHDYSKLRAREKAPQIGFSWLCALEAVHESMFFEDATTAFISVGLADANEKVMYGRKAIRELPEVLQNLVPLTKDTTDELRFGAGSRLSRIFSIPATSAMRGKRMSVYLDEVDFYRDGGHEAFRAAMGRITRGGRITMGSTCFGVDTQLDKVMAGEERAFSRSILPWSVAEQPEVLETIMLAKQELDPEDFAEEYECVRGGSTSDTFPAQLMRRSQHDGWTADPDTFEPAGPCVAGYDVGRTRHPSVLSILVDEGGIWRQRVLHAPTDSEGGKLSLPGQHTWLRDLMRRVKRMRLVLDVAGVGAHIGEALHEEFGDDRVVMMYPGSKPATLPSQEKAEMVTEVKRGLEAAELELVPDVELAKQFRRTRLLAGGRVEQPGSRKRTHYDLFWSTVYSWYGTRAAENTVSAYEGRGLVVLQAGGRDDLWA